MLIPTLTVTKRTKQFACIPIILCQRYNFAPKSRLAIICISLHSNLSLMQARAFCACIEKQSPVQSLILFQTNWILNLPLSNSLLFFFIFVHSHDLFSMPHPCVISSMKNKTTPFFSAGSLDYFDTVGRVIQPKPLSKLS